MFGKLKEIIGLGEYDEEFDELEETEENTITLITCIENEPEYRRCVRAIEK